MLLESAQCADGFTLFYTVLPAAAAERRNGHTDRRLPRRRIPPRAPPAEREPEGRNARRWPIERVADPPPAFASTTSTALPNTFSQLGRFLFGKTRTESATAAAGIVTWSVANHRNFSFRWQLTFSALRQNY